MQTHSGNVIPEITNEEHFSRGSVHSKRVTLHGYVPGTDSLVPLTAIDNGDGTYSFQVVGGATDAYKISDIDDLLDVKYYGYLNANGAWYIMQEDSASSPKTFRFCKGSSGYVTAFTNRATQTYDYYDAIF